MCRTSIRRLRVLALAYQWGLIRIGLPAHKVFNSNGLLLMCAGMWAPGLTGLVVGLILLFVVRDSPEQVGFPPVEVVEKAKPKKQADGSEGPKESLLTLLVNNVLKNPFIWGMALTYFFIYVVRQGVTSWFVFYLIKVRCRPPLSNPFIRL